MEIKAGNRKLLLPYDDDLSYWSQVKHRTAAFLFVHDNGNDFVVCCRCGYTRRTKRYCSDNIECPNCGNFHRWNSGKTYVEYSVQNILLSNPKIITQNGEKNVRFCYIDSGASATADQESSVSCFIAGRKEFGLKMSRTEKRQAYRKSDGILRRWKNRLFSGSSALLKPFTRLRGSVSFFKRSRR